MKRTGVTAAVAASLLCVTLTRWALSEPRAEHTEPETETILILNDENEVTDSTDAQPFVGSFLFRANLTSEIAVDTAFEGDPESVFRSSHRLGLGAESELLPGLKAQISGRLSWSVWVSEQWHDRYTLNPELRDSWLSWSDLEWLTVTVGYQTWSWGVSDFFGPVDQLNPRDFRDGISATLETTKIPVLGLNVDFLALAPTFRLGVVWIPFFEADRVFVFGDDFGLFGPGTSSATNDTMSGFSLLSGQFSPVLSEAIQPILLGTDKPDETPAASTIGVRMSSTVGEVDFSAHYLYGWDRTPVFRADPELAVLLSLLQPGATLTAEALTLFSQIQSGQTDPFTLFSSEYERCHIVGADVTFPVWDFGVRLEAAYQTSKVLYTEDFVPLSRPTLQGVLGLDYSWETAFVTTVEVSYRHIFDYPTEADVYLSDINDFRLAIITVLRLLEFDALELQMGAMVGFRRKDVVLLPQAAYRFSDSHRLAIGARIFEGATNTIAGTYDDNDEVYVTYDWSF